MSECAHDDCTTILSRYNPSRLCAAHEKALVRAALDAEALGERLPPPCDRGDLLPWNRALLGEMSKGYQGLCSEPRCQTAATICRCEGNGKWRAWCEDHCPPSKEQIEAARLDYERRRPEMLREDEEYRRERIGRRPKCAVCGEPVGWDGTSLTNLGPPEVHHRLCVLNALGIAVSADVAEELRAIDHYDVMAR